jgi:imidazolonepropionase-like amidohydrolase
MVSASSDHKQSLKPWKPSAQRSFIFNNVNLVDVETGVIHENATVKLSGGRIESIKLHSGTNDNADPSSSSDVETRIDFRGKYLCPGLTDCHVHVIAVPREGMARYQESELNSIRLQTRVRLSTNAR